MQPFKIIRILLAAWALAINPVAADASAAAAATALTLAPTSTSSPTSTSAVAADSSTVPDCLYCQARLGTLAELRALLPSDWTAVHERDPVFGGMLAVVQAGRQNAQTVLLIHGLGRNGLTDWLGAMPRLAREYHVIAVDLPGYGYSSSPAGKYSPTRYAQVMRAVLTRHSKAQAIVVGHSMGGAVALRLAADAPAQVAKLVLVNAAGILQRNTFVKAAAGGLLSSLPIPQIMAGQTEQLKQWGGALIDQMFALPIDPAMVLEQSETAWSALLVDRSNVNAALALVDEDFSAALDAVQAPTQIIWGEADPVAPLRTARVLADRLPNAQVHVMPGVGHTPMQTDSASFNALLVAVLAAAPLPAARFAMAPSARDLECTADTAGAGAGTGTGTGTPPAARRTAEVQVERAVAGGRYGGHYREVRISGCNGVVLQSLSAQRMVIRNASVSLNDVVVRATDVALQVTAAEVTITAASLSGQTAIRSDGSQLDLAGVRLQARGNAIEVVGRSHIVASVSQIRSPAFTGPWHETQALAEGVFLPRRSAP